MLIGMLSELTNHLWQSTMFAFAAGLLTLVFRKNGAQIRYWLWLSASLKFLVPFSLLISAGSHLHWTPAVHKADSAPTVAAAMMQMGRPFSDVLPQMPATGDSRDWIVWAIFGFWACGFAAIAFMRLRAWRRIRVAVQSSTAVGIHAGVEVRSVPGLLGPGVVGLFHPILLIPPDIQERLKPSQLMAVLSHELCHVRRRDNLTAAAHMVVEAIFWFYPLIWWIGSRLIEERERACDEAVLISGTAPHDYATGILKICKGYVEARLSCVSGVTGANLKKRIKTILIWSLPRDLSFAKKLILTGSGTVAVAVPIAIGILGTPLVQAQSQVAPPRIALQSLELTTGKRPVRGFADRAFVEIRPGYFEIGDASLRDLIRRAYGLRDFQIGGGPPWIDSHDYEVIAKASDKPPIKSWMTALAPILQTLLQERFKLKWHYATRDVPAYVLTVAPGGNKLLSAKEKNCSSFTYITYPGRKTADECGVVAAVNMRFNMQANAFGMRIAPDLVNFISFRLGRSVIDKTGLKGRYDFQFEWNVAATQKALGKSGPAPGVDSPTIFTALQQQLGLKLKPGKSSVRVLIVDHAERPALDRTVTP